MQTRYHVPTHADSINVTVLSILKKESESEMKEKQWETDYIHNTDLNQQTNQSAFINVRYKNL